MQLSLHADYACRVLLTLAAHSGERLSVRDISDAYGISAHHLVKVVHKLGKLGYIHTTRGRGGGLELARPAEQISMGHVIRHMEPGLALVECFDLQTNTCPITAACGLKGALAAALEQFFESLDRRTLAQVAGGRGKLAQLLAPTKRRNAQG